MDEIKVFISQRDSTCDECGEQLGHYAWITLQGDKGALCLSCADLDHLVFLPSGDTALTRRARKHSRLSAVVLKWSRARKRYERQGLLVEEKALEQAEAECAADSKARHAETRYDHLLLDGWDRHDARAEVDIVVGRVLERWADARRDEPRIDTDERG